MKYSIKIIFETYCQGCGLKYWAEAFINAKLSEESTKQILSHSLDKMKERFNETPCPKCNTNRDLVPSSWSVGI